MSGNNSLLPVIEHGWRSGFANMLWKENSLWWHTRKWWVQAIIWTLISNGVIAFILWGIPLIDPSASVNLGGSDVNELVKVFLQLESFFATFGVMVLSQGLIVNEKSSAQPHGCFPTRSAAALFLPPSLSVMDGRCSSS